MPGRNPLIRLLRRFVPVTDRLEGEKFFIRRAGVLMATPLLLVLLVVESTDLVFAIDSIPAVLAVTQEPFLVYTSNVFAILGLRALYFLLAGAMSKFHYLKLGLSFILGFVGMKMLVSGFSKISPSYFRWGDCGGVDRGGSRIADPSATHRGFGAWHRGVGGRGVRSRQCFRSAAASVAGCHLEQMMRWACWQDQERWW